jgi:hypothetical protein
MTSATTGQGRSRAAVAAQVAGIVGVVVCVLIILVTWFGRGQVAQGVDDLRASVDRGLGRAITAADAVSTRLETAATSAGEIAVSATEVVSNPPDPEGALAGLTEKVGRFADAYRQLRVTYAGIREDVTSSIESLQRVARFVPGVEVPQGPVDTLKAVDESLRSLDESLTSIWPASDRPLTTAAATAIADKATALETAFTRAATLADGLATDLKGVQARAARAADSIGTILTLAALAITILFVWVLLLNIALWFLGREHGRATGDQGSPAPSA